MYYAKWVEVTGAALVITGLVLYFIVKCTNALSLCLNGFKLRFSAIRWRASMPEFCLLR